MDNIHTGELLRAIKKAWEKYLETKDPEAFMEALAKTNLKQVSEAVDALDEMEKREIENMVGMGKEGTAEPAELHSQAIGPILNAPHYPPPLQIAGVVGVDPDIYVQVADKEFKVPEAERGICLIKVKKDYGDGSYCLGMISIPDSGPTTVSWGERKFKETKKNEKAKKKNS